MYKTDNFYDEIFSADGKVREFAAPLMNKILSLSTKELTDRQDMAEALLMQLGITFSVYGQKEAIEKIMPFDIIPRIIQAAEWEIVEKGLKQRIKALNLFINDIYNDKNIIKDGVILWADIESSGAYSKECEGITPPKNIWSHISGIDLVRDSDGKFYVLEDNLRCPSGISYVLENRNALKRTFPKLFEETKVRSVNDYPRYLLEMLQYIAPEDVKNPKIVVLTPGVYNSAYFEHSFLAKEMGVGLVEGRDLVVSDGYVKMKTTKGLQRVDVIYRRIDDDFLDPEVFNKKSLLGVAGIMEVYRQGRVALANAPGAGVADDKMIYAYVPKIIKYYLNEEPILPNVRTYLCSNKDDRKYVLENIKKLVIKPVNLSGGYGILIGSKASEEDVKRYQLMITENPRNYVAQPILSLSRSPTVIGNKIEGRHVDFRPYILSGKDIYITQGGLTRVALQKGSLMINSSQGGGGKDSWVLY